MEAAIEKVAIFKESYFFFTITEQSEATESCLVELKRHSACILEA